MPRSIAAELPRPLSALERLFWLAERHRPNRFCVVAEVEGERPAAAWAEAFGAVTAQVPLAGCAIVADAGGTPWFRPDRPPVLEVVADRGPGDWPALVAGRLAQPPSGGAAPMVRGLLLHGPRRATLVLEAHHAASDGLGLAGLLRDVLRAAGGEPVRRPGDAAPAATEDRVRARHGNAAPLDLGPLPPAVPLRPLGGDVPARPSIGVAQLTEEETARLRRRARAEGTTAHAAVTVALAASLRCARPGGGAVRVVSPIDLRRRLLGGSDHLGLCVLAALAAPSPIDLGLEGGAFWEAARRFASGLAPALEPAFLRGNLSTVEQLAPTVGTPEAAAQLFATVYGCELLVTNLGVLDMPGRFGDLTLAGAWGPAVTLGFAGEQAVGVATAAGRLRMIQASFDPVTALLERAIGVLREA